ncbi:MAG: hypothetical protein ACK5TN_16200 [Acidobacteriota bacterium]
MGDHTELEVVGYLDPILHCRSLGLERQQLDRTPFPAVDLGQAQAAEASQAIEESDLIQVRRVWFRLIVAQAHKTVFPFPTLRLVAELACEVGVRVGGNAVTPRPAFTQQPAGLPVDLPGTIKNSHWLFMQTFTASQQWKTASVLAHGVSTVLGRVSITLARCRAIAFPLGLSPHPRDGRMRNGMSVNEEDFVFHP